jgi:hypothetical protein
MKFQSLLSILQRSLLAILPMLFVASPAHAGNIFFGLSITDNTNTLTLTNQGNSIAYYPAVLRLMPDGQWISIPPKSQSDHNTELSPGAHLDFVWATKQSKTSSHFPLDAFRPVMVRFFDQAGSGFGQISFFNQPLNSPDLSQSSYVDGLMTVSPPDNNTVGPISNSWLLWPQEEGIAPLFAPVTYQHKQPPAKHIEWRDGTGTLQFNLGAGLPMAILLHETPNGYMAQTVMSGGMQGTQQRAVWLNKADTFFKYAYAFYFLAFSLFVWQLTKPLRKKPAV